MYSDDDLLPLSALQHLLFCPRQCGLIHIEQLWAENPLTVQGRHLHDKADTGQVETRGSLRIARSLLLRSFHLGIFGKADVVEFRRGGPQVTVYPVEYKRGRPKSHPADRVQLCAQAMCLEEMLKISIPSGALFYGKTRRRLEVLFDEALRKLTEQTADQLHAMFAAGRTPMAEFESKCERCSLRYLCLPEVLRGEKSASNYVKRALQYSLSHGPPAGGDA